MGIHLVDHGPKEGFSESLENIIRRHLYGLLNPFFGPLNLFFFQRHVGFLLQFIRHSRYAKFIKCLVVLILIPNLEGQSL